MGFSDEDEILIKNFYTVINFCIQIIMNYYYDYNYIITKYKRWLYAMVTSFCLSVRLFVCLSPGTRNAGGGGGLSRRPFRPQ